LFPKKSRYRIRGKTGTQFNEVSEKPLGVAPIWNIEIALGQKTHKKLTRNLLLVVASPMIGANIELLHQCRSSVNLPCESGRLDMSLKTKINLGLAITAASTFWMASAVVRADNAPLLERPSPSTTVSFRDLDLQRSDDVARLYRRLEAAADQLCGPRAFNVFYRTVPAYRACVADAVQKAVARINQPMLSGYSRQRLTQARTILPVAAQ
jgi:UrcA family protein